MQAIGRDYAPPVMLPGTPSSVRVRAYEVYLAANADCSNPIVVQDEGAFDYVNVAGMPTGSTGGAATYATPAAQDVFQFFSTNPSAAMGANGRMHGHQMASLGSPVVISPGGFGVQPSGF